MNSIYFITFLFLFCFINSEVADCSGSNYHLIDTANRHYKAEISFDWTSEDEYELNVPFTQLKSKNEITPFLINATVVAYYNDDLSKVKLDDNATNILEDTFHGYKYVKVIPDDRFSIHLDVLRANIKSTDIPANKYSVGEVYKYYFGWVECGDSGKRYRTSKILVSVNNGKFYQISKYLLFVIAGLLL
jgi:hypothetical protein